MTYKEQVRQDVAASTPHPRNQLSSQMRKRPPPPGLARPVKVSKARLQPLDASSVTDEHRGLIAKYSESEKPSNGFMTLLHLPELIVGTYSFQDYVLKRSSLTPRHRQILVLRTAWLLNSECIWCENVSTTEASLNSDERRQVVIGSRAPGWTPIEATLIALADELFINTSVSEATWTELSRHYDMFNLLDALMTVADMTCVGLIYNSLGIQVSQDRTELLPADLPYSVSVAEREPDLRAPRVQPLVGAGLAITRTFANYPALAAPRSTGAAFVIKHSKLSPRYREILILRTGWNTQSEYEWAQHVGSVGKARELGLNPTDIALGRDSKNWDPVERLLIEVADELYTASTVSQRTWDALEEHFDATLMMSVIATVANYRMVSMALNALGVQIEPTEHERFPSDACLYI